jgi:hypothetical protein
MARPPRQWTPRTSPDPLNEELQKWLPLGQKLREYMQLRSELEEQETDLWFAVQLYNARRDPDVADTTLVTIYGIRVDLEKQELLEDEQEPKPGFFDDWKAGRL